MTSNSTEVSAMLLQDKVCIVTGESSSIVDAGADCRAAC